MHVFLDMDGVIADFTSGVCSAMGLSFDNSKYPFPAGLWDYGAYLKRVHGVRWEDVTTLCNNPEFWEKLPMLPDAKRLYEDIAARASITFLTTATGDRSACYQGKLWWLLKHGFMAEGDSSRLTCLGPGEGKGPLANPESVLIDDKDSNVQDFIKAGGKAIVVPRPWNNSHFDFIDFSQANTRCLIHLRKVQAELGEIAHAN